MPRSGRVHALLMMVVPGFACGATPARGASGTGTLCVPLSTDTNYADECLSEFCIDTRPLALHRFDDEPGLECVGPGGSLQCEATGLHGQQFSANHLGGLDLHLSFDNSIVGNYSAEAFNETYVRGAVRRSFTYMGIRASYYFYPDESLSFGYADGRLELSLAVTPTLVMYEIESNANGCLSDDVSGYCSCRYEGSFPQLEMSASLPIQGE